MMFDDPRVKEAARLYGRMLDYQNADHSALSWDQAVRRVIHGKAAFTAMGDWAYSELVKAGLKGNQDFGWVSFPGTEDTFLVVADGFALAKDAPNIAEAVAWLEMVGSKEAQEAFNALKVPSQCAPTSTRANWTSISSGRWRRFSTTHCWRVACMEKRRRPPFSEN
jgi:glucose/mannose transport system substrate-binding protein